MKNFATAAALIAALPRIMAITINTPMSVVQCQPQLLTWSDGVAPYYLSIIPGGQPSASPLKSFDTTSGNSVTWVANIPAGTAVTFSLKDSTGATAFTDVVTIQKGSDSSCLNGGAEPAAAPAAGGANPAPPAGAAPAAAQSSNAAGAPVAAGTAHTTAPSTPTASRAIVAAATTPTGFASASAARPLSSSGAVGGGVAMGDYRVAAALGVLGAMIL